MAAGFDSLSTFDPLSTIVWTFVLVLTRISGLFMVAPFFGATSIPRRVRALLAASVALLITILHLPRSIPPIHNLVDLTVLMAKEAALGMILALALLICFLGIQLAGQLLSHLGGLSVGVLFDPTTNTSQPILSQLLYWVALSVFLTTGGHRQVMEALLDLFVAYPPGYVVLPENAVEGIVEIVGLSIETAWRAAAPVAVSLLLSMVILGLIGRTLPQLNVLAVGLGANAMLTLAGLFVMGGTIVWVFQQQQVEMIDTVREWLLEAR